MVTIKEREDSVQTRNKTNLKGIEDSKWIPYVFNFKCISLILLSTLLTNHAFAKLYVWLRQKLSVYAF